VVRVIKWAERVKWLLGICIWWEAPETAVGGVFAALRPPKPDRKAGKRGRKRCLTSAFLEKPRARTHFRIAISSPDRKSVV
jgi:hypothetical protein